ncbi:MAG: DUF896 domain-containing protein [Lachnospiraceae bacterium]|nr:DUF896 domain-containing protein [Candidatus Hippenecus merdae]
MTEKDIERISELYRISQTEEGLTEEEKKEQAELRKAYIMAIRRNLRGTLENIDLVDENGNVVKSLGEKGK